MLTTFNEVDMSAIMELRSRRKEAFQERNGVKLGFMSFFTKASIGALKAFPNINAELQDDELILKRYYDVGVAVLISTFCLWVSGSQPRECCQNIRGQPKTMSAVYSNLQKN